MLMNGSAFLKYMTVLNQYKNHVYKIFLNGHFKARTFVCVLFKFPFLYHFVSIFFLRNSCDVGGVK